MLNALKEIQNINNGVSGAYTSYWLLESAAFVNQNADQNYFIVY